MLVRAAAAAALSAGLASAAAEPALDEARPVVVAGGVAGLLWPPPAGRYAAAAGAPVPAVIVAQDAPGVDPRTRRYAAQLEAAGIFVLELDLFPASADGVGPAGGPSDAAEAAAFLTAAAGALARDPRVDPTRIGALGFGAGGRAALLAPPAEDGRDPFAARAALYPGCGPLPPAPPRKAAAPRGPVLLLHGDADPADPPAACAALAAAIRETAPVRRVEYRGAGFAWDWMPIGSDRTTRLPRPDGTGWRLADPWPELAEMSAAQVAGFFALALAGRAEAP